jgi:hypothetical protein
MSRLEAQGLNPKKMVVVEKGFGNNPNVVRAPCENCAYQHAKGNYGAAPLQTVMDELGKTDRVPVHTVMDALGKTVNQVGKTRVKHNVVTTGLSGTAVAMSISGTAASLLLRSALLRKAKSNVIALKSHHDKYLSAQPNYSLEVNRSARDAWEKFQMTLVADGQQVTLFSLHLQKYVCVQDDGLVVCNRSEARAWETFNILAHSETTVSLKSHLGLYLSVRADHTIALVPHCKDWEIFTIEYFN